MSASITINFTAFFVIPAVYTNTFADTLGLGQHRADNTSHPPPSPAPD
jgi:hypothetical protein